MKSKLLLAAAIAAISLGAGAAQAQPGNAGATALAPSGIAAQEAVSLYLNFGHPYYYRPYYYSPYYAPQPYQGPYQYCHLGVCY